ncbi:MAG: AAA family ATPase [Candidatus Omnitrophica bacterium]|nr:AAA family ATPase [Candidatus Omnitrophota bacterium]
MRSYIEDTWDKIFGNTGGAKRIFIAATRQNVGKTTISLGLISTLKDNFQKIGFIKPVGQRYLVENGYKIDEDSVLMERIFKFKFSLHDMSPIAVERGYTERFIDTENISNTSRKIKDAFEKVAEDKDLVIIEGTGHAGVGSVFDLSNAAVAKMLNSRVILISPGGIGSAIDEIMLNKAVFDRMNVKLAGVIVNKVLPKKYDKVNKYVRKGLERLGIPVLGVIPYVDILDTPTMQDFREELDMHVLCGEKFLDRQMRKILVGAMEVREAARHIEDDCLVITPGDRVDFLNLLIKIHLGRFRAQKKIAGIILSGGIVPPKRIYNTLKKTNIPTLLTRFDTYDVASKVHDLTVKIKARDKNKIRLAMDMVKNYVNIEKITENLM